MAWWSELAARRNTINLFSVHQWNSIKIWKYYQIFDFQTIFKIGQSYVEKSKNERKLRKKTVIWFFAKFEKPDQIDHQIWDLMTNELISHRSLLTSETYLRFAQLHLGEDRPCFLVLARRTQPAGSVEVLLHQASNRCLAWVICSNCWVSNMPHTEKKPYFDQARFNGRSQRKGILIKAES